MSSPSPNLAVYDSAQPRRPLISEFRNLWIHRGLIRLLVNRELTVRYKRSALGVWWTLLNPLITTAIMWLVFSQIFGRGRFETDDPYVLYLLAGVLFITFFSQALLATGASITGSSAILTKVYVPPEVFSFATSIAGAVNFLISLIPLVIVQLVLKVGIPWTVVLIPIPILAMLALVTGLGMLIAAGAVFFYDVLELSRVGVTLLTYITPVFWPIDIVPERFLPIAQANPLFSFLEVFRSLMYRGVIPPLWQWAMILGSSLVALSVGVWFFSRSWRSLVSSL